MFRILQTPSLGRLAALDDIAFFLKRYKDIGQAVVFLASDAASYITGATLPVSGGPT
jgi:NAD(P)-dependent dehydrogenase (short-subunit alcohol dehydrogenase family)